MEKIMDDSLMDGRRLEKTGKTSAKYLKLMIDNNYYGLKIDFIDDIIGIHDITEIPDQKNYVEGVINLRGKIIPTIDIRKRFNMPSIPYDERTCIIVLSTGSINVGVIVDRVIEVVDLKSSDISSLPIQKDIEYSNFLDGIANKEGTIMLLNSQKLLNVEEEPV